MNWLKKQILRCCEIDPLNETKQRLFYHLQRNSNQSFLLDQITLFSGTNKTETLRALKELEQNGLVHSCILAGREIWSASGILKFHKFGTDHHDK